MNYQASRILARNVHILVAIAQAVYIYTPVHEIPHAIAGVQWVTFPLLVITGLWLRKGQVIWHHFQQRRSAAV